MTIEDIHKQGEKLLMRIHRSVLVPIGELSKMAEIINAAYELGKSYPPNTASSRPAFGAGRASESE